VKKVTEDAAELKFNTAISQMMILVNEATASKGLGRESAKTFMKVLSPFAPHIAEELWEHLGGEGFVCQQEWPRYDASLCQDDEMVIVVQVNGKRRDEMRVAKSTNEAEVKAMALAMKSLDPWVKGQSPKKVIYVPSRLVNIVVEA
jgi:leucyl-tRNA synthetase